MWTTPVERTIDDVTVDFAISTPTELSQVKMLERSIIADVLSEVSPGDVFYDIGANIGTYSCFVAAAGVDVVAFEPHPGNASSLGQNRLANSLDTMRIRELAISDSIGKVLLDIVGDEVGGGHHHLTTGRDGVETLSVEGTTIDAFVRSGKQPPTAMKIDVEGAELAVLEGATETLQHSCELVYCEVHQPAGQPDMTSIEDYGHEPDEVTAFLDAHGYDVRVIDRRARDFHIKAERQ